MRKKDRRLKAKVLTGQEAKKCDTKVTLIRDPSLRIRVVSHVPQLHDNHNTWSGAYFVCLMNSTIHMYHILPSLSTACVIRPHRNHISTATQPRRHRQLAASHIATTSQRSDKVCSLYKSRSITTSSSILSQFKTQTDRAQRLRISSTFIYIGPLHWRLTYSFNVWT